jgi:hypothetical protein
VTTRPLPDILAEQGWTPDVVLGHVSPDGVHLIIDAQVDDGSLVLVLSTEPVRSLVETPKDTRVYRVADTTQAVDVLCALGVLPAHLSSMWLEAFRLGMSGTQEFGPERYLDRNDMPTVKEVVPDFVEGVALTGRGKP